MASDGSTEDQKRDVAKVAQMLFGLPFEASQVIGETLERATPEIKFKERQIVNTLRETIESNAAPPENYENFKTHPLSSWIE